jgi:peptide/nickel transport system ATP-binding protein
MNPVAEPASAAQPLLSVRNLGVSFKTGSGLRTVVPDLSFDVQAGERLGIVGESGSGKTVTGLALLGLLPGRQVSLSGEILFGGRNLLSLDEREMTRVGGRHIAMIFQEPMSALDPVFTIGTQIAEAVRQHFGLGRKAARERAVEMLDRVGIPLPRQRVDEYPHQLSGGMRQRAMIAMALACEPRLLIADEPTTALDVTIQAQILDLIAAMSEDSGTAVLFISHNLGAVSDVCARMMTMYAGQVVEDTSIEAVLRRPRHPYSSGLLRSLPRFSARKAPLPAIPGRVPQPGEMPAGCRFAPRCAQRQERCDQPQPLREASDGVRVRCVRHDELQLLGALQ